MKCNLRTYRLALEFYKEGRKLKLSHPIKNQFERASLSIVLNIAEGWGRFTKKDRKRFFYQALGSLRETATILEIIENKYLINLADKLGASLYLLCIKT